MPDELEYIVDKAVCHCDKGASPNFFKGLANQNVKINGCMACTKADKIAIANIPSFGVCSVTNSTCAPAPVDWTDTYKVKIKGKETLLFKSTLPCGIGGKIEFMTSGQIPVSEADLAQMTDEHSEEQEEEGWGWWDTAELIPVVGSLIGIVRSAAKGNWWMAAANVGFLAMDVAGVVSFGATTVASTAAKGGLKAGLKVAGKAALGAAGKVLTKQGAKALAKGVAKHVDDIAKATMKVCVFACFPEGTPVHTASGQKNIEEIVAGDEVWAWDEESGTIGLRVVTATMQREVDATVEITLEGETIETTAEHPFYTREGWKDAADLSPNDELKTKEGEWRFIKSHKFAYEKRKVFNFEVEGWHTYFVGILAWLVHNARPCLSQIKHLPDWLARMYKGNYFNFIREGFYKRMGGFNEVVLSTGKRVDSYIPGKEIVSRKFTQLANVTEETAKKYIDELATKYAPGTAIKETARNADAIAKGGKELSGKMILEVPKQAGEISKKVLEHASDNFVQIRDITGEILNPF
ncbi:polymorphic toxin-type HINT domain-containing protein [Pedobacter sp. PLR]|uniref:polymorphic toxin-type HINT domain-containing protein n=1 Tax=Pedobacter sp. PLR TaxID=2994465 RepID=UPI002246CD02|nr:polymorphic toxin-type HINT domain-containing protein [Pedobacter sp. PLR]MCX2449968.1 polymorphic toxin-type HINT domain-containing protein [Pedobacter sp. PLR]